jgi:hypothetical protein
MIKNEEGEFVEQHHQDTIRNVTAKLEKDPEILALMTSGSIAHGFQKPREADFFRYRLVYVRGWICGWQICDY